MLSTSGSLSFNFVTTFYPPYNFGGDGIFVYRLANALARRGHRVKVVHCADAYAYMAGRAPAGEYPNHPNVVVHALRSRFGRLSPMLTYAMGLPGLKSRDLNTILNGPADVTHFHNVSLVGGPGILRYGSGVKLYTTHEHWLVCPTHILWKFNREPCVKAECFRCSIVSKKPPQPWRYTSLLSRELKALDALIAPSEFTLKRHAALGVRTELLPHFVPEPTLPVAPESLPVRPYVLYSGRLEKAKGILWLVEVFRRYRSVDLVVAGEGTDGDRAREAARDLAHISFVGRKSQLQLDALYRNALAVVVPSLCYETFGLVAVEAMANGAPIIVRGRGALPEVAEQSKAGFTFDDADDLVAVIDRIREEPGLRSRLSQRAIEAYRERWTEERHLDAYFNLIADLRSRPRLSNLSKD